MPIDEPPAKSARTTVPLKIFVHLAHGYAADKHRALHQAGLAPDVVPYGFHHAEEMECKVQYSRDHSESTISAFARRSLSRVLGFDLVHAYRNRKALSNVDFVWTMEERQFLAVLALPVLVPGLRRPRVIAQSVWLFNNWKDFSPLRRAFFTRLLRRADRLTVHSANYLSPASAIVPAEKVSLLPFGISLDSFPFREGIGGPAHRPIRILTMGNNVDRDWPTLLAAFGNDGRFDVVLLSLQIADSTLQGYNNLRLPRKPAMQDLRDLYRWADYAVVPMVKNLYSGITVALEATSMGVPVVSSRTGGIPTYFDSEEVLYVEPEDPIALRNGVLACTEEERTARVRRAQRRFLREDYSTKGMVGRYLKISKEIISEAVSP